MDLSSVVTSVLGQLANLALNKASELKSVREQVVAWQAELVLIQGKLKDVESKENKSNTEEIWMNQLEVVANRIRTVIETFQKIEEDKSKGLQKIKFKIWKKPLQLNDLSAEMGSITQNLKMLKEYGPLLGIQLAIAVGGSQVGTTVSGSGTEDPAPIPLRPTNKCSDVDDPEVVGLDSDKHYILKHLLDETISRRTILSIVGVGGLGKTTLAQKIYNSSELDGQFHCRKWLSISQNFNEINILRELIYSIEPQMKNKYPPLEDKDLVMEVKRCLSDKRYLIILDDVWTKDLWDSLRKALPDSKNGSRVIITTRDVDVARAADRNTKEYQLHFLKNDESIALLFRTAFQRDIQPANYPPPLKDVSQKLIKKCGGLPLALVVLGGILSTEEDTFSAWNRVYETMDWHDEDGEKCMKVLAMSYEALPSDNLKQCLLYFASFPEDYNISAKHMTRMWVAEGLIPKPRAGTLEDQAEKYLQELVKRCLVQVTEKSANGNCKYCRMHDLLQDLTIYKAEEENFFTIFSKGNIGNQGLPPSRVALHSYTHTDYVMDSTNTCSLLCFQNRMSNYQGFEQLRVLVFERVDMPKGDVCYRNNWLEGLVHLRYLGFRYCHELPEFYSICARRHRRCGLVKLSMEFSLLKSLETLDCCGTKITISSSLWKIPTLRHVTCSASNVYCPLNWGHLKNLQTLKWVRLYGIPKIECNVNLRTLKIFYIYKNGKSAEKGWQGIQAFLSRTEHLVSLAVKVADPYELPFLSVGTRGLSCHEKIQSLFLYGKWAKKTSVPIVEMFPTNLTKLKLEGSAFEKDPMPTLERLQSLRILHMLVYSYVGTKMICSTRGFSSLQKLKLAGLPYLSEWEIEEGAMPLFRHLQIHDCGKLHTLPELQNVSSLQKLIVTRASIELQERLKIEDQYKIEHIPSVRITTDCE